MNALQLMLEALKSCRIMARDADGNYTREVTPMVIQEAIAAGEQELRREPDALQYLSLTGKWCPPDPQLMDTRGHRMTTTLPPLPDPAITFSHSKYVGAQSLDDPQTCYYTADQMTAYGQQCRAQALEESAKHCEDSNEGDLRRVAGEIRSLK